MDKPLIIMALLLVLSSLAFASCDDISTSTTLSSDATTCKKILANNTVFDCAGFMVAPASTDPYVFYIEVAVFNATIKNCKINGTQYGVFVNSSLATSGQTNDQDAFIYNNTFQNQYATAATGTVTYGVYTQSKGSNWLSSMIIENNTFVNVTANCTNPSCTSTAYGVHFDDIASTSTPVFLQPFISNNIFYGFNATSQVGINLYASALSDTQGVIVRNNTFYNISTADVQLATLNVGYFNFGNNTHINATKAYAMGSWRGVSYSYNCKLSGDRILNSNNGIIIASGTGQACDANCLISNIYMENLTGTAYSISTTSTSTVACTAQNLTIVNASTGISITTTNTEVRHVVKDSQIFNSTVKDVTISAATKHSRTLFLNTTFNSTSITFSGGNLTIQWYARLNVTDFSGGGVVSNFNVTNNQSYREVAGTTSSSGVSAWFLVNDSVLGASAMTYNNQTISVNGTSTYTVNQTAYNFSSRDQTIHITLYHPTTPTTLTDCTTIYYPGSYTLSADIEQDPPSNECIVINSNNVNFDCDSHYISAYDTGFYTGVGISIKNANYTNISNCDVDKNWLYDIYANNSNNLTIINTTVGSMQIHNVENSTFYDIESSGGCKGYAFSPFLFNNIKNTNITNSSSSCIRVLNSDNLIITNSSLDNRNCEYGSILTLNNTNNTQIFFNYFNTYAGEASCNYELGSLISLDNSSYGNNITNNLFSWDSLLTEDDCGVFETPYNIYISFIGDFATNQVIFNTTNQTGTRIFSNGTKIGGNYYRHDCQAFGQGIQGYSNYCVDLNTDGFCDNPFVLLTTEAGTITDYLPLSNNAVSFTIRAFDETTGNRIYFTATIVNATSTVDTGYQYLYETSPYYLPTGSVSVVVSNTSYYQSKYVGTIPTNADSVLDAYLLPQSNLNAHQVSFLTVGASSQVIPGVLVSISRTVNGETVSVGQAYTDSTGVASFYMDSTVSYTVTASMLGYSTVTQVLFPTQPTYTITMGNWSLGIFHQTFYDIQWTFSPKGILDENRTYNLTFSTFSSTGKIVWFAWKIFNGTSLIHSENMTAPNGGTINYSLLPGHEANITVYFYIMRTNMSDQQLAIWRLPLAVTSFYNKLLGDIHRFENQSLPNILKMFGAYSSNSGGLSSFSLVLGTLILGVLSAAWVSRFSPTGGQLTFVIIMAIGTYMGVGIIASISLLIFMIFVAVAYQLWRSGG